LLRARQRVLEIQTKLHRWVNDDPHRRPTSCASMPTCTAGRRPPTDSELC